jgi:hypothetical protein
MPDDAEFLPEFLKTELQKNSSVHSGDVPVGGALAHYRGWRFEPRRRLLQRDGWVVSGGTGAKSHPGHVSGQDWLVSDSAHGQIVTDGSWSKASSTLNSAGMAQWTSVIVGDVV